MAAEYDSQLIKWTLMTANYMLRNWQENIRFSYRTINMTLFVLALVGNKLAFNPQPAHLDSETETFWVVIQTTALVMGMDHDNN